MTLRTITFDDEQWQVVPKQLIPEMLGAALWPACLSTDYALALAAAPEPETCFCDAKGIGDPAKSCGDCPRDYGIPAVRANPEPPAQQPMTVAEIEDQSSYWHHWYLKTHEELEAVRQGWIRVVDEFLVTRHLGIASPTDTYDEARAKLLKIIDFEIDIATDPVVGGDRVRKKVPMTDEEAKALISPVLRSVPAGDLPQVSTGYFIAMMRAVERHHGIGKGDSNA